MHTMTQENRYAQPFYYGSIINYSIFALLITLMVYWNLVRSSGFSLAVLAIQVGPLLALIPGIILKRYRSYNWLCFLLLFYFIFAVERVFTSVRTPSDFVFLTLIVLLFISSMMTSRWLQRLQKGVE